MSYNQSVIIRHGPRVARYAVYALLVFTPLARGSFQPWAITTIHLMTLIAFTALLLEKTISWNWKRIKTPLDKPMMILLILCILSTIFSLHRETSIWSIILLINYVAFFYLVIHTTRTRAQFRRLLYTIIGMATILSILGILKSSGINPFPWWEYPHQAHSLYRMSSTFGNPNHLAGYMEMALPIAVGSILTGVRRNVAGLIITIILLMLLVLILTLSRGGWIGAFVGLSFMTMALLTDRYASNKKLIIVLAAGFLFTIFVVFSSTHVVKKILTLEQVDTTPNFSFRVIVWKATVEMIKDYPLLGAGPGTFATVFSQYQPPSQGRYFYAHNDYLHFTAELGLVFIPIVAWMIILLYRRGFKKLKNESRLVRGTTLGALCGITAILVHSISDFNLQIPSNALLFTLLAALVVAPFPIHHDSR
ncbi:MAG: hypothetical protein GY849_03510 [Deltaproteobacteria bacterium]|nr:hypothetical protein [Deltaproteobacteria bacterium]